MGAGTDTSQCTSLKSDRSLGVSGIEGDENQRISLESVRQGWGEQR